MRRAFAVACMAVLNAAVVASAQVSSSNDYLARMDVNGDYITVFKNIWSELEDNA